MPLPKRAAVIHSLAGFGKCSLTIALPVLSAAGVEACPLPTSVLSSHTGGLPGFTCRDLTQDMTAYGEQWRSLSLHFDVVYTGFLGSAEQISVVCALIERLKSRDTLVVVDPCMGDNGKLYQVFDSEMVKGMRRLCAYADLILPNRTEASFLLGQPYDEGEGASSVSLLKDLCAALGPKRAVLTGAFDGKGRVGAISFDSLTGESASCFAPHIEGHYHGTGDLFASVLVAGLVRGIPFLRAAEPAVAFTQQAIGRTRKEEADPLYGILFEEGLPRLSALLDEAANQLTERNRNND